MKIAITDACIFIDLLELDLSDHFFKIDCEIHTSVDVINELFDHHKELLQQYVTSKKLTIHNISGIEKEKIRSNQYPNSLSDSDKTVLFLAEKIRAIVLSSDRTVRYNAKIRSIEYHGMLWIFDKLVELSILKGSEAAKKLLGLINGNMLYINNTNFQQESKKRLSLWQR